MGFVINNINFVFVLIVIVVQIFNTYFFPWTCSLLILIVIIFTLSTLIKQWWFLRKTISILTVCVLIMFFIRLNQWIILIFFFLGLLHIILFTYWQIINVFLIFSLSGDNRIWFGWFVSINFNIKFSGVWFVDIVPFGVRYIDILSFSIFRMLINLLFKWSLTR